MDPQDATGLSKELQDGLTAHSNEIRQLRRELREHRASRDSHLYAIERLVADLREKMAILAQTIDASGK